MIKSLNEKRRQGRREKEIKGRDRRETKRHEAEEVRCCSTTWQITQERGLSLNCEQMGGEGEAREKHKTQEIRRYRRM